MGEGTGLNPFCCLPLPSVLLPHPFFISISLLLFISVSVSISVNLCLCVYISSHICIHLCVHASCLCISASAYFCLFLSSSSSVCVSLVSELHGNTPHLEVQQGQSLRLLCAADSQPPATLSWGLENRVLSWSSPVSSRTLALELLQVKAGDSGHYTCQAENRLGSQQHTLDLSVLCECDPPKVLRRGRK